MPSAADHFAVQIGRVASACAAVWINLIFSGCSADRPLNPSFPLTYDAAREDLRRMRANKVALARPVVVAAGIFDPGAGSKWVGDVLREVTTTPEMVVSTGFWGCDTFDDCAARLVSKLNERFPPSAADPMQTVEVDAVAVSMGGVVSRVAALRRQPDEPAAKTPRLNMRRLFTIGSPHHGAEWWDRAPWDQRAMDMRPGGPLLRRLELSWKRARERGAGGTGALDSEAYDVYAYVRLGDQIVGEENAAGPDGRLWWVGNPALEFAHLQAFDDPRILVDIARRLRGEAPFTTEPAAPLPAR
ncbi:MAG: hypothetical protein ACKVZJ_07445 [Phycisphaerales bacterium]